MSGRCRALLLVAALGAAATLSACGGVQRPEGIVERWLTALNQGSAGLPGAYAAAAVSDRVVPPPRDIGVLNRIVVGRGRRTGDRDRVPFEIEFTDSGNVVRRVAVLRSTPAGWRVEDVAAADPTLPLPDEGGPRLGGLSPGAWALSVLAAVSCCLAAALALRAIGATPSVLRYSARPGRPHR